MREGANDPRPFRRISYIYITAVLQASISLQRRDAEDASRSRMHNVPLCRADSVAGDERILDKIFLRA